MRFAVIGAGNTGKAVTAYLKKEGQEVVLYCRNAQLAQQLCQGLTAQGAVEGKFEVKATSDLAEAVRGAQVILVQTVAPGHAPVAQALKGLLEPGQIILIFNGNWGAAEFAAILGQEAKEKGVAICETGAQLVLCSSPAPTSVYVKTIKQGIALACTEAARTGKAFEQGDAAPVAPSEDAPAFATHKYALSAQRRANSAAFPKVQFTEEMREAGYTILCPQMAPIHFDLVKEVMKAAGYNFVLLPSTDRGAVEAGLRYVNNDICYPSILVTGQIMEAIESGKYDLDRTAVIISQTGGGCRATNYIALIRKALRESGNPQVPVISLAAVKLDEQNPGFKLTVPLLKAAVYCVLFGDVMMQMLYRTRPYEATPGAANALFEQYMDRARKLAPKFTRRSFTKLAREAIRAFDTMPLVGEGTKPRVGVVGEILVKFHPTANNHVVEVIENEGCEAVVPGLLDFFLYSMSNAKVQKDELGSSATSRATMDAVIGLVDWMRKPVDDLLEHSMRFERPEPISAMAEKATKVLSLCNNMGEGWLLTAEMLDLIDHGAPNIICTQPFACLPNHVVGKAVIKELRRQHPESNIVAVDYDPGASEVNQLNRIKLMISVAKENLRAGKGFKMQSVKPLAMDMDDSKFRPHHEEGTDPLAAASQGSCAACGAVSDEAVAAVAERIGQGVGGDK